MPQKNFGYLLDKTYQTNYTTNITPSHGDKMTKPNPPILTQEPMMTDVRIIKTQAADGTVSEIKLHSKWLNDRLAVLSHDVATGNTENLVATLAETLAITYWFFQRRRETAFEWAFMHHNLFDPQAVDNMFEDNLAMLNDLNGHMITDWRSKPSKKWEHMFLDLVYLD